MTKKEPAPRRRSPRPRKRPVKKAELPAPIVSPELPAAPPVDVKAVLHVGSGHFRTNLRDNLLSLLAAGFTSLSILGSFIVQSIVPMIHTNTFQGIAIAAGLAYFGTLLVRWVTNNSHEAVVIPPSRVSYYSPSTQGVPYTLPSPYAQTPYNPAPYSPAPVSMAPYMPPPPPPVTQPVPGTMP